MRPAARNGTARVGSRRIGLFAGLLVAAAMLGCPKNDEIVRPTVGPKLEQAQIDSDPLALLPGGMVGLVYVDTKQLFAAPFGQKLLGLLRSRSPLPAAAGFDPERDIDRAYVGFYSMQGADVAAVVQGRFDAKRIEEAASGTATTPLGAPVVRAEYAGYSLYVARNVGFVVLTSRSVLIGNETAIRRSLDRIKEGRAVRRVPEWLVKLIETPNVPMAGGGDLRVQPTTEAVRQELKFLNGLETVRMLGNFKDPGLNFAGTLTYETEQAAQLGAAALVELRSTLQTYGWMIALLGVSQPVKRLEAQPKGKETQFVVGIDGLAIGQLFEKLVGFAGDPKSGP